MMASSSSSSASSSSSVSVAGGGTAFAAVSVSISGGGVAFSGASAITSTPAGPQTPTPGPTGISFGGDLITLPGLGGIMPSTAPGLSIVYPAPVPEGPNTISIGGSESRGGSPAADIFVHDAGAGDAMVLGFDPMLDRLILFGETTTAVTVTAVTDTAEVKLTDGTLIEIQFTQPPTETDPFGLQ